MNTRPNWTYDIWMLLHVRPEHVSVIIIPIEIDMRFRQVYCEVIVTFLHSSTMVLTRIAVSPQVLPGF
jgi:hypothetical protein